MRQIRCCKCGKTVTHTSHIGQDGRTRWVWQADCPRECETPHHSAFGISKPAPIITERKA